MINTEICGGSNNGNGGSGCGDGNGVCENEVDISNCGVPECISSDIQNEIVGGEPRSNSVTATSLDGGDSWGWVQAYIFGVEEHSDTFDLWAGATENNANNEGTFVGTARVEVAECDDTIEGGLTSVVTWNVPDDTQFPLDNGLCMKTGTRYVHISNELPEMISNDETDEWDYLLTNRYDNQCCVQGQPCYIILQTSVSSYYCEESNVRCSFDAEL